MINLINLGSGGHATHERPWTHHHDVIHKTICFDPSAKIPELKYINKNMVVYKCCVAKQNKKQKFYILNKKENSSLKMPNYSFLKSYYKDIPSRFFIQACVQVDCLRLDAMLEKEKDDYDFIKSDVQGMDIEAICSAGKFLTESIVGLHVELWFKPIYRNTMLFEEANIVLKSFGFKLIKTLRRYSEDSLFDDFLYIRNDSSKAKQIEIIRDIYK